MTCVPASEAESFESLGDSGQKSMTSISDATTNRTFFIARPAPPRLCQRLSLRPRLILQVQRASRTGRAFPLLELWRPGIFTPRVAEPVCAKRRSSANDLYIIQCDSQASDAVSANKEEDIIALMRQSRSNRKEEKASTVHFIGGWIGRASRVSEGHYECVWEHSEGQRLKMESAPSSGQTNGDTRVIRLSDDHVQNVDFACMDGKSISFDFAEGSPLAQGAKSSNLLDLGLIFNLWILIQDTKCL